jgi:alanine racemase
MLIPYSHPAWIEIDLDQFKKNIQAVKNHLQGQKLCLPVKANAYGHGLVPLAQHAQKFGVDYLAVSCLQEGVLLRESQIHIPILVLGAIHEDQIPHLIAHNLEFTLSSKYKSDLVLKHAKELNKICLVHIEVETGMQRTGMRCETAEKLIAELSSSEHCRIAGIYSHMATADIENDSFAQKQVALFSQFIQSIREKYQIDFLAHLANSGGVCYLPSSHFDMVRPGLLIFGYFQPQASPFLKEIAPFFSLKAKVAYFKVVSSGSGISYNHTYVTKDQTRVITVPVGYGDGYRRCLSNIGAVLLRGKKHTISGNVCMDQFMVDIGHEEAYVGDEVVLIGRQENQVITVQDVSRLCQTIPYEVLCSFNERIPRIYVSSSSDSARI